MYRNFNNNSTNDFINVYKFRFFLFLQQIILEDGETDNNKYFLELIRMYKQLVIRKKTKYTSLISILKFMKQNNMIDNRIRLTDIIDANILKQLDNNIIYGSKENHKNININDKLFKNYDIKNNVINSSNFTSVNNKTFNNYSNNINYKTVNNYYNLPNNVKLNLAKTLLIKLSKFIKTVLPILKELTKIFKSDIANVDINKKDNLKNNNKEETKEESNSKNNDIENNINNNVCNNTFMFNKSNNSHNSTIDNKKTKEGNYDIKGHGIPNNKPNIPTNPNKPSTESNNPTDINENQNNINDNSRNQGNLSSPNNFNNRIKISENISSNNVHNTKIQKNEITINSEGEIEYTENTNEIEENIKINDDWLNNFESENIDKTKEDKQNNVTQSTTEKILSNKYSQKHLRNELGKLSAINKLFGIISECSTMQNGSIL